MRFGTTCFLAFVFTTVVGCSSTNVIDVPQNSDGGGAASENAACGDGVKAATEACDDGNLADGDGCSKTCSLLPASLELDQFAFHSEVVSPNGAKSRADVDIPVTKMGKLPYFTDTLSTSIDEQTDESFKLRLLQVAKDRADFVSANIRIPRVVGPFTIPAPTNSAWVLSARAPLARTTPTCRTDDAQVLSESRDRRVYRVKLTGTCTWTDSGTKTTETLSSELTITLLP